MFKTYPVAHSVNELQKNVESKEIQTSAFIEHGGAGIHFFHTLTPIVLTTRIRKGISQLPWVLTIDKL